jgi:hypothetical protein
MWRGPSPFEWDCAFEEDLFYAWGGMPGMPGGGDHFKP